MQPPIPPVSQSGSGGCFPRWIIIKAIILGLVALSRISSRMTDDGGEYIRNIPRATQTAIVSLLNYTPPSRSTPTPTAPPRVKVYIHDDLLTLRFPGDLEVLEPTGGSDEQTVSFGGEFRAIYVSWYNFEESTSLLVRAKDQRLKIYQQMVTELESYFRDETLPAMGDVLHYRVREGTLVNDNAILAGPFEASLKPAEFEGEEEQVVNVTFVCSSAHLCSLLYVRLGPNALTSVEWDEIATLMDSITFKKLQ